MVEPADDLESGVALAWRLGRDCTALLHALYIQPRVHESLTHMFTLVIRLLEALEAETQSASARAKHIENVDITLEAFTRFEQEAGLAPSIKE